MDDKMFDLLASEDRRRILLRMLRADTQEFPLSLSDDLIKRPGEPIVEYHMTYHCHLPKLADSDVIEWDVDEETVTRGAAFDQVRPLLECLQNNPDAQSISQ